jgi:hypothetical protein
MAYPNCKVDRRIRSLGMKKWSKLHRSCKKESSGLQHRRIVGVHNCENPRRFRGREEQAC